MIHPHTELRFINEEKGFGVVATQFIPKGTITWAGDPLDQIFTVRRLQELDPVFREVVHTYAFRNQYGEFVLCWDHSRFVNHSYVSNCMSTPYNLELAVRDIYPGEELTDDYGYLNVTEPMTFPRESGSNRTAVYPDDLLKYHEEWDAKLEQAFKYFNKVSQPLGALIGSEYIEKVKQVAEGKAKMDSILNCYLFDGSKKVAA